jgi:hypothetical protein
MKRKRKRAPTKRSVRAVQPRSGRAGAEELNAESRALLGAEDKPRSMRPEPRDDASVEDPLRDWPED